MQLMGWSRRIGALQAIIFAFLWIALVLAIATVRAGALNGPAGFVFFLLIGLSLFLIALGVGVGVWRLMARVLPSRVGIPERLLFAFSSCVLVGGCGPLVLCLAVYLITHVEGSAGASGIWALMAIFLSGLLCMFAVAIFVGRIIVERLQ
jgi:hypothetical protein